MNQKILDKLNPGEKIVQIEEFGDNTHYYKVTIYVCISKFLWIRHIDKIKIPFYFETKELATEFLKYYDNIKWEFGDAVENRTWLEVMQLTLLNYTNRNEYYMVDINGKHLMYLGVWGGIVNTNGRWDIDTKNNIPFKEMFNIEEKLKTDPTEINPNKEYVFKMIK